jgi:D-alanyl-D-alanine carboxypeptidase (penicillin-binding protein 5/6)
VENMKKIIVGLCLIISIFSFGEEQERTISKLLGTSDGNVINIVDGDKVYPLASVTKMMTILLTYEAIESGKISMDDMVNIPEKARKIGGSRIWMAPNDRLSVRDLIKATAIYSANNTAYSLAYYVGDGSVDKFVAMMNEKAKSLGMKDTVYYTPAGLPPHMTGTEMDVSTANDIYKLSMVVLKNQDYMEIASRKEDTIRKGEQKFKNRNKLLGKDGIYGIKTGHHDIAGYNISIVSKKNGLTMIEIVLGAPNEAKRDTVVLNDLDNFYSNYSSKTLLAKGEKIATVDIKGGKKQNISFYSPKNFNKMLNNDIQIKNEVIIEKNLEAPVKAGTVVGEYRILLDGEVYLKMNLVIKDPIEKLGLF